MSKRSNFERQPRDYYVTPYKAVLPLLPWLKEGCRFIEPCAGNGALVSHLERHGHHCVFKSDIEPLQADILSLNALDLDAGQLPAHDYIITNSPWDRPLFHAMILKFINISPTWMLMAADWAYTEQSIPYMKYCHTIIAMGRQKWFPGTKHTSQDSTAWYGFSTEEDYIASGGTTFIPRSLNPLELAKPV